MRRIVLMISAALFFVGCQSAPVGLTSKTVIDGTGTQVVTWRKGTEETRLYGVRVNGHAEIVASTDAPHFSATGDVEVIPGSYAPAYEVQVRKTQRVAASDSCVPAAAYSVPPPPPPPPPPPAIPAAEAPCAPAPAPSAAPAPVASPPCCPGGACAVPVALAAPANECRDVYAAICTGNPEHPRVGTPMEGWNYYYGPGPFWPCPGAPTAFAAAPCAGANPSSLSNQMAASGPLGVVGSFPVRLVECLFGAITCLFTPPPSVAAAFD